MFFKPAAPNTLKSTAALAARSNDDSIAARQIVKAEPVVPIFKSTPNDLTPSSPQIFFLKNQLFGFVLKGVFRPVLRSQNRLRG